MPKQSESDLIARLAPQERRCLDYVARHYSTGEIATALNISQATVAGYLADARAKLGASSRKEAVRILIDATGGPNTNAPSNDTGRNERDAEPPSIAANINPQPHRTMLSRLVHLDRIIPPSKVGPAARLGIIVGLVIALALALALAVLVAAGLTAVVHELR